MVSPRRLAQDGIGGSNPPWGTMSNTNEVWCRVTAFEQRKDGDVEHYWNDVAVFTSKEAAMASLQDSVLNLVERNGVWDIKFSIELDSVVVKRLDLQDKTERYYISVEFCYVDDE